MPLFTLLPQRTRFFNRGQDPLGIPGRVALRGPHKPQDLMSQASATQKRTQKQQGHRGPVALVSSVSFAYHAMHSIPVVPG
jgi:hypothetical protein